jgi:sugar lactone lactonase YvrE
MKLIAAECVLHTDAILGEGPVWDDREQRLWWVDIERRQLHRFNPGTGKDRQFQLEDRVGFAVPSTHGDWIIGTQRGLMRFDPGDGSTTFVDDPESDRPGNRFNDAKCDAILRDGCGRERWAFRKRLVSGVCIALMRRGELIGCWIV